MNRSLPDFMLHPDPDVYFSDNWLCLDFETTNIENGNALNLDNKMVLACWKTADGDYSIRGHELEMSELVVACNNADFLIAHHAKFELQWLERCGYDIGSRPVWCTMVGEWVISGNRRWQLNLDACLARIGMGQKEQTVSRMIKAGVCPSDIPPSMLLRYGVTDTRLTYNLFRHQRDVDMRDTRLINVQYTRCLVIPALADIEGNGLHLDSDRVEEAYAQHVAEYQQIANEMDGMTGGINPRSPTQLAHFIYGELGFEEKKDRRGNPIRNKPTKQFPDGLPITREEVLLSLGGKTPEQKRFLALKKKQAKLASALDKNLSMFVGACREKGGMMYGELAQGRTVTHRLASSGRRTYYKMFDKMKGCQFQNLPRKFKRLFCARHEGWVMEEDDYTQLEFGTAGHCGKDALIAHEVATGYDVHSYTRDVINSVDKKEIDRTGAKRHTFKPLFGGQSGTKGEKTYYKAFAEKYFSLKETQDDWCIEVAATKKLETEWGLIFYWPEAKFSPDGWLNVKTNVYNCPIQSLATADIVPIGLSYLWHRTRDMEVLIVNTVHDSIESELPRNEIELYRKCVVQSLLHDVYMYLDKVYDLQFTVNLGISTFVGTHWGELPDGEEELKVQVESPYGAKYNE